MTVSNDEARAALRAARAACNWSRNEAAERGEVHRNTVLRWESEDEQWGARITYLRALLEDPVSRPIILRILGVEPAGLEALDRPDLVGLLEAVVAREDEPVVGQTLDLLRTLVGEPRRERTAATA